MKVKLLLTAFALLTNFAAAECCSEATTKKIHIEHPLVRPAQKNKNTGAYMSIKLDCMKATDTLLSAESEICTAVEIHDHINDNGIMRMRPVKTVQIKNGEIKFVPGGLHVMLMGLKRDLVAGETIKIRLNFEKAGAVDIDYQVGNPAV
ncbi:copper chaperone PCu(A)C [Candidatus Odyssella thessalonicensis]|uniref:copper chaperone PCu(A)C n=1 Tax=Candidatus Odyssella thessalonicensis TaxID=84647 RepID=UPI000225A968|nr:copper chaperone PCu(A)C [Candidatus Odyssella thessalonicensis]